MDIISDKDTTDSANNFAAVSTSSSDVNCRDKNPQNESLFTTLYKYNFKSSELSQEQRRDQLLDFQKQRRNEIVDAKRSISDLFEGLCENNYEEALVATQTFLSRKKKPRYSIMLSEWMMEIPSDYPHKWLAKFCPDGHRNLIVAVKNVTKCFSRTGKFQFKFLSNLPGGGRSTSTSSLANNITVLDCIYNEKSKVFFILDVIAWNGVPFYTYEADCRFFCLKSRFEELTPLRGNMTQNYQFHLLDHVDCDPSFIHEKMNNLLRIEDHEFLYDGILFYHKESEYVFGETPLALWLKSFMVPEMLDLEILPNYIQKVPANYRGLQVFLQQKQDNRKDKLKNKSDEMETS